jgi:predicted Zn-dependent peptidase
MVACSIQTRTESFEVGFHLLCDVLLDSCFTPEHVEKERAVLQEEVQYSHSNPEYSIWGKISESVWVMDHLLGRPVEGRLDLINEISYDQLKNYYHHFFVPENLILIISGPLKESDIKTILHRFEKKYYNHRSKILTEKIYESEPKRSIVRLECSNDQVWVDMGGFH